MPSNANMVIKTGSDYRVFCDTYKAHQITELALSGREYIDTYVSGFDYVNEGDWFDHYDANHGLLIDDKKRHLLLYSTENDFSHPYHRLTHLRVLRKIWPDWTVRWAHGGQGELRDYADGTNRHSLSVEVGLREALFAFSVKQKGQVYFYCLEGSFALPLWASGYSILEKIYERGITPFRTEDLWDYGVGTHVDFDAGTLNFWHRFGGFEQSPQFSGDWASLTIHHDVDHQKQVELLSDFEAGNESLSKKGIEDIEKRLTQFSKGNPEADCSRAFSILNPTSSIEEASSTEPIQKTNTTTIPEGEQLSTVLTNISGSWQLGRKFLGSLLNLDIDVSDFPIHLFAGPGYIGNFSDQADRPAKALSYPPDENAMVLIDAKQNTLLIYQELWGVGDLSIAKECLSLLSGIWKDWRVEWCDAGAKGMRAYIGLKEKEPATAPQRKDCPDQDPLEHATHPDIPGPETNTLCLITREGKLSIYPLIKPFTEDLIAYGPEILNYFHPEKCLNTHDVEDNLYGGVHFDMDQKKLSYWTVDHSSENIEALNTYWEGWAFENLGSNYKPHFALTKGQYDLAMIGEKELLASLKEALLNADQENCEYSYTEALELISQRLDGQTSKGTIEVASDQIRKLIGLPPSDAFQRVMETSDFCNKLFMAHEKLLPTGQRGNLHVLAAWWAVLLYTQLPKHMERSKIPERIWHGAAQAAASNLMEYADVAITDEVETYRNMHEALANSVLGYCKLWKSLFGKAKPDNTFNAEQVTQRIDEVFSDPDLGISLGLGIHYLFDPEEDDPKELRELLEEKEALCKAFGTIFDVSAQSDISKPITQPPKRFTESTYNLLRQAGWYEGRSVNIEGYIIFLEGEDAYALDITREFLSEFGGLQLFANTSEQITIDPTIANTAWDFHLCREYMGDGINMVGEMAAGDMTLVISKEGKLYATFDQELTWIGDSIDETMENLCQKKSEVVYSSSTEALSQPKASRFSERTHDILTQAGWHEGRQVDTDKYVQFLEEEDDYAMPIAKEFLQEFGRLELFTNTSEQINLDPTISHPGWDYHLARGYMGDRINMVGNIAGGYCTLLISEEASFYAIYEQELLWIGDSIDEAIENLCQQESKIVHTTNKSKTPAPVKTSRFTQKTTSVLTQAGWHEGRRVNVDDYVHELEVNGTKVLLNTKAFLEEFGGLKIMHGDKEYAFFNPEEAYGGWDDAYIREYTDEYMNTVGALEDDDLTLLISDQGRFYAIGGHELYWAGDNTQQAIENICHERLVLITAPNNNPSFETTHLSDIPTAGYASPPLIPPFLSKEDTTKLASLIDKSGIGCKLEGHWIVIGDNQLKVRAALTNSYYNEDEKIIAHLSFITRIPHPTINSASCVDLPTDLHGMGDDKERIITDLMHQYIESVLRTTWRALADESEEAEDNFINITTYDYDDTLLEEIYSEIILSPLSITDQTIDAYNKTCGGQNIIPWLLSSDEAILRNHPFTLIKIAFDRTPQGEIDVECYANWERLPWAEAIIRRTFPWEDLPTHQYVCAYAVIRRADIYEEKEIMYSERPIYRYLFVDGERVFDPRTVCYNDGLNFGRFFESEQVPYTLTYKKEEFITAHADRYQQVLEEIKADDEKHDDNSSFSEIGYASLRGALEHPDQLLEIVETYLCDELFKEYKLHSYNQYIINSLDSIEVDEDEVRILGRCFKSNNTV